MPEVDMLLDGSITEDEIKRPINNFKNGKASGDDGVLNEYLKSTLNEYQNYCHFFLVANAI
jgi:hypothetical protein